jgi:hypothetical protein
MFAPAIENSELPRAAADGHPAGAVQLGRAVSGGQSADILRRQRFPPDGPVSTGDFMYLDPGDATHVLAFDRYHGVGKLLDHLTLLFRGENVFNQVNFEHWHRFSPVVGPKLWGFAILPIATRKDFEKARTPS